ncbi:hypothetical protein [Actibacterium pelagium]|uniref:DUF2497 domain-containing protein n=1 Tax=Actibacterium pelagium TaxID=2029103 RepID=A0A917AMX8_9RHOB|nr:hypothetical protein [Actibacterium pelagium]GGE59145.1 hypothetical protein GCM10011517_28590 [Actibacterium pelagium]
MTQSGDPAEINEVLSSIRRLVSDGSGQDVANPEVEEGKLVLTSDHRIVEQVAELVLTNPVLVPNQTWEETSVDDRVLRLENAVAVAARNWPAASEEIADPVEEADVAPLELSSPLVPVETKPSPLPAELVDTPELRNMIAEILREELKGEVGDKLSQSLRKVVRREIARALTERDLS